MRRGFTLIELLVVITIIVVLLALLTPALDEAVYQAQLLTCATNQKLIITTSQLYAVDNKRTYPFRDLPAKPAVDNAGVQAHKLAHPLDSGSGVGNYDLRPMLRPYVPINKAFNDPFVTAVDLDKDDATGGSSQTTHVYAPIFYWAGWQYSGLKGIRKLGDRFEANTTHHGRMAMDLLVGDVDCNEGPAYSSHPDNKILVLSSFQDAPFPFGGLITATQWTAPIASRDPLDLNFGYGDGSVLRMTRVRFFWSGPEEGMTRIANFNNGKPGWNHVPKR